MTINDVIITEKAEHLLKDNSRFILLSGPTGTGKTFIGGLKTFIRIMNQPKGRNVFAIVAESIGTAEKMFIDDSASFVNIFPNCRYIGGKKPHIRIETKDDTKKVYLGGYGTKRDWKRILGLNLHGMHIEEITIADDDFIRESFVRVNRLVTKPFLHATTNGGIPEQICYTEFFDKSVYDEEWNRDIPLVERQALKGTNPNFKFYYWGFRDSPTMTKEEIDALYDLFPVGSFYYNSKVIGARGYSTGMCYASLFTDIVISKEQPKGTWVNQTDIKYQNIHEAIIGIDVGSKAKTVFTLTGYTHNYQRSIVLSVGEIEMKSDTDYTDIVNVINKWLIDWYMVLYTSIKQIRVDKSNPLFIKQLRNNLTLKIPVLESISGKTTGRVIAKTQLIKQFRLVFVNNDEGRKMVNMLKQVKEDGKGGHVDNNTPEIDYSDSLDYSLEPNFNKMAIYKFRR